MPEPQRLPPGLTVDAVDWLPSGARSGLVRVRGSHEAGGAVELPDLVLEAAGAPPVRHASLPDPRADREPSAWRGAYVVEAAVAAAATVWRLEWPGGTGAVLERPAVGPAPVAAPEREPEERGGQVVDRAVLAERRARRAEAAEQAQARVAQEALRAVEVLELRTLELEQRLEAAEGAQAGGAAEPQPVAEARPEPSPPGDPARLREALAATLTTVAELRLQLYEAQLSRRSREVEWSAGAVRLVVLEREHGALRAQAEAARADALAAGEARAEAEAALAQARADADGAAAAHEETRRRFMARVAELDAARGRIAELEGELAGVREEASRAAAEQAEARVAAAEAAVAERVAAAEAAADERAAAAEAAAAERAEETERAAAGRVATAEAAAAAAAERAAHARDAVADALMARELAEAAALAASAERRAAEVAHAVAEDRLRRRLQDERPQPAAPLMIPPARPEPAAAPEAPRAFDLSGALGAAAGRLRATAAPPPDAPAPEPAPPVPVPVPDAVAAAAAEQERAASAREAPAAASAVAADLDAAAKALRTRPTIVSAPGDPPGDVVRGAAGRGYPLLRGALVKLAHDDPAAAAGLLAGLLPAARAALGERADFDVTVAGAGTFSVRAGERLTEVVSLERPRGRFRASFHLRADAVAAAGLLAGTGQRLGRLGAARVSGRVRRARALVRTAAASKVSLHGALAAGARLDPVLALRALAYAVHPLWVDQERGCIEVTGPRGDRVYACLDRGGLHVRPEPPDGEVAARVSAGQGAVAAVLEGEPLPAGGDPALVEALGALARRAAGVGA